MLCVDVSSLSDGTSVVVSWTGTNATVWSGSFSGYADPWYAKTPELQNISNLNNGDVSARGDSTRLTGDLLSGTSTTVISSPGADYKYLRAQIPILNPHLPGSWTISNMTVTAGDIELPILNIGGFFTNSNIVVTYNN